MSFAGSGRDEEEMESVQTEAWFSESQSEFKMEHDDVIRAARAHFGQLLGAREKWRPRRTPPRMRRRCHHHRHARRPYYGRHVRADVERDSHDVGGLGRRDVPLRR